LRNTALWCRAIAARLDARQTRRNSVFARTQLCCWRLARTVTGKLRAHPYPRYQREPGAVHRACTRGGAGFLGAIARRRGRSLQILALELQRVGRELDDARALTLSKDLSDQFGRSQLELRSLIKELDSGVRNEARTGARTEARNATRHEAGAEPMAAQAEAPVGESWPYLAL
jgi:hypothetical protein